MPKEITKIVAEGWDGLKRGASGFVCLLLALFDFLKHVQQVFY